MSTNPYQTPAAVDDSILATEEESLAASRIRWAVLLLSVGAFANLACIVGPVPNAPLIFTAIIVGWNLFWLGGLCWIAWRFAPSILDGAATLLHRLFGGPTTLEAWLTSYRESLWILPLAAGLALPLWFFWLVCFFGLGMQIGGPLNTLFLIAGNALGGWVYVSIIAGWVRLRMHAADSGGSLPPAIG